LHAQLLSATIHANGSKLTLNFNEDDYKEISTDYDLPFANEIDYYKRPIRDILAICEAELLADEKITSPTLRIPIHDPPTPVEQASCHSSNHKTSSEMQSVSAGDLVSSLVTLESGAFGANEQCAQNSNNSTRGRNTVKRWLWKLSMNTGQRIMGASGFKAIIKNGLRNMVRRDNTVEFVNDKKRTHNWNIVL
jgi:hypothetical protein